jgi:uncharacterized protein (DUF2267 family)
MPHAQLFARTVEQTHQWLRDLNDELGWADEHKAQRALKAGLHALRDRLTVNEAVQVGSQLPALVRGYYYEGWRPSGKPLKERHLEEFLEHIERSFQPGEDIDAEEVARAVFRVLSRRISAGEIEDVKHILPRELRDLWS